MTREELYNGVWHVQADPKHSQWGRFIKVMDVLGNTPFDGILIHAESIIYGRNKDGTYCIDIQTRPLNSISILYTVDEVLDAFYFLETVKTIDYDIF